MRSSWKLKALSLSLFRKKSIQRIESLETPKFWTKGTRIFSDFLEKNIVVYNGSKFVDLTVKREMLGGFIGSYVLTKRITADIHSKSKKNKKGRMKKKKK